MSDKGTPVKSQKHHDGRRQVSLTANPFLSKDGLQVRTQPAVELTINDKLLDGTPASPAARDDGTVRGKGKGKTRVSIDSSENLLAHDGVSFPSTDSSGLDSLRASLSKRLENDDRLRTSSNASETSSLKERVPNKLVRRGPPSTASQNVEPASNAQETSRHSDRASIDSTYGDDNTWQSRVEHHVGTSGDFAYSTPETSISYDDELELVGANLDRSASGALDRQAMTSTLGGEKNDVLHPHLNRLHHRYKPLPWAYRVHLILSLPLYFTLTVFATIPILRLLIPRLKPRPSLVEILTNSQDTSSLEEYEVD